MSGDAVSMTPICCHKSSAVTGHPITSRGRGVNWRLSVWAVLSLILWALSLITSLSY